MDEAVKAAADAMWERGLRLTSEAEVREYARLAVEAAREHIMQSLGAGLADLEDVQAERDAARAQVAALREALEIAWAFIGKDAHYMSHADEQKVRAALDDSGEATDG